MEKKTLLFVFGTRPELIKMIPLIKESKKRNNIKTLVCSTGQHKDMLASLYSFFDLTPDIDFQLMKPNQSLTGLHSDTMNKMSEVITEHAPHYVIVQGDTTSAHAAAMAAFYSKTQVAHIEAGLRTYDINSPYPEEMNRRVISLIAKVHLCPTAEAAANLKQEKIDESASVEVTGNTGIDTLMLVEKRFNADKQLSAKFENVFSYLNLSNFILTTVHRRENFGDAQKNILKALLTIVLKNKIDILFPVHPNPNVRQSATDVFNEYFGKNVFWISEDSANDNLPKNSEYGRIFLTDPLDYPALVYAMKNCRFVMTDSGGLQEEAPTFAKKILVLRSSTERPEGVSSGFSQLVGTDTLEITNAASSLIARSSHWDGAIPTNPYGDGLASERIINLLS